MKLYQAILFSLLGHGVLLLPSAEQPLPDITIAPIQVVLTAGESQPDSRQAAPRIQTSDREPRQPAREPETDARPTGTTDRHKPVKKRAPSNPELATVVRHAGDTATARESIRTLSDRLSRQQAQTRVVSRLHHELKNYFNYPLLARRNGWEGKVVLALDVYLDGRIYNVQLKSGSGHRVLDRSALNAVSRIRNLPDMPGWQGSSPLNIALPVIYRLQG